MAGGGGVALASAAGPLCCEKAGGGATRSNPGAAWSWWRGLGSQTWGPRLARCRAPRARGGGSRVRGSLGKRLRDAGKAMGKECCRAGTLGGWRVRAACRAEINRRAPPTPTSRSLAGHWRLSLPREGGRVGGKASKPVQLFRARGVPGQGALGRVQSLQH